MASGSAGLSLEPGSIGVGFELGSDGMCLDKRAICVGVGPKTIRADLEPISAGTSLILGSMGQPSAGVGLSPWFVEVSLQPGSTSMLLELWSMRTGLVLGSIGMGLDPGPRTHWSLGLAWCWGKYEV